MNLLAELKRRNVFRMAVLYAVSAWLVLQVGDVLFGVLGVPDWSLRLLLAFLALGFPFALIFSWIYELTPEGVKKESEVDRTTSVAPQTGRKIDRLIIVVLAIAVVVLLVDRWRGEAPQPAAASDRTIADESAAAAEASGAPSAGQRSIAVLPFEDFSSGADEAWFAQGLSEEILNALARTPDLLVASRTSAFRYADTELPVTQIASELGVAHVLEGSVRRTPERIRVTAQLIRASDGFHLWSENYDRTPEDIIAIQEDIAQSIALALETAMDPEALAAMMATGTRSVEAYNAYLEAANRANAVLADGSLDPADAIELAERAVQIDPTFARAHELLSFQYRSLANTSIMTQNDAETSPEEYRRRFEAAIGAAITHASNDVDRRYYEAIQANSQQRLALAEERYRAYLADRPNDGRAVTELADILISRGKLAEARAVLAPLADGTMLASWMDLIQTANYLVFAERPDEAMALFERILAEDPLNATALYQKHRALLWAGRTEEASAVASELERVRQSDNLRANVALREACAAGDRAAAEDIVAGMNLDHLYGQWYGNLLLGNLSRSAAAFAPLDETEVGLDDLAGYLAHPHFDPTPYPRLMSRIGDDLVIRKPLVAAPPFACPPAERPSVAVLPFTTRSRNDDDVFFSDGVHDDLLTQLARIGGLKVISRTSVLEYRDTPKNLREIGAELGVGHIVEGAVQRSGATVRITAQLIDAATDEHLWADSFDRELTAENLFAIQTEIATNIARALEATLSPAEIDALKNTLTDDLEALAAYQRALRLRNALDIASFDVIDTQLARALTRDPDFAAAYALRARNHLARFWISTGDDADRRAARADIDRARELDPDLREIAVAEGYYHYWGYRDYASALAALDPLRAAYPNDLEVTMLSGWILRRMGRASESVALMQQALALSPRDSEGMAGLARTLVDLGRYDEAQELIDRMLELDPNSSRTEYIRGYMALVRDGDAARALDHWLGTIEAIPTAQEPAWLAAISLGQWDTARAIAEHAPEEITIVGVYGRHTFEALAAVAAGEDAGDLVQAAIEALEPSLASEIEVTRDAARLQHCLLAGAQRAREAGDICRQFLAEVPPDAFAERELAGKVAAGLAMAGLSDDAFELLEGAMTGPYSLSRNALLTDPFLEALHADPRWSDLVEHARP